MQTWSGPVYETTTAGMWDRPVTNSSGMQLEREARKSHSSGKGTRDQGFRRGPRGGAGLVSTTEGKGVRGGDDRRTLSLRRWPRCCPQPWGAGSRAGREGPSRRDAREFSPDGPFPWGEDDKREEGSVSAWGRGGRWLLSLLQDSASTFIESKAFMS